MNFLVDNWYMLVIAVVVVAVAIYVVKVFFQMPKTDQIAKVQEWLLYAVAEAEKQFGSGTGQLKLRYVYDNFVARFPAVAQVISFDAFSLLVDKALEKFNTMINSNKKLQTYIETGEKEVM